MAMFRLPRLPLLHVYHCPTHSICLTVSIVTQIINCLMLYSKQSSGRISLYQVIQNNFLRFFYPNDTSPTVCSFQEILKMVGTHIFALKVMSYQKCMESGQTMTTQHMPTYFQNRSLYAKNFQLSVIFDKGLKRIK